MQDARHSILSTAISPFGQQCKHILFLFLLLSNAKFSHQFASWLVDREVACYTIIRDPTEIIMNYPIKLVEKSDYPNDVYIEVLDIHSQEPVEVNVVDGRRLVYVEETLNDDQDKKYLLKLIAHPNLKDLQYVMDIVVLPERDEDEEEKKDDGDRMAGKFTGGTTGCGDSRAHGRVKDGGLELEVNIPSSLFSVKGSMENAVEVVAAWACGHEAITLTHPILFLPMGSSHNIDVGTQHGIDAGVEIDSVALVEEGVQDIIVAPKDEQGIQDVSEMSAIIEHSNQRVREAQSDTGDASQQMITQNIEEGVQGIIVASKNEQGIQDGREMAAIIEHSNKGIREAEADTSDESHQIIIQNEAYDQHRQTNHHAEEGVENNGSEEMDASMAAGDASQQTFFENEATNEHKLTDHYPEEEIQKNGFEEMDAIIEGLNKVEEVIQNNSPEKMDEIMEGLNKVEELIQNKGIEEMDAIMNGLNKVEDLIEDNSPEEMDSITERLEKGNIGTRSIDTTNNLRQRDRSKKVGDKLLDTPTDQKINHKKHHRPDPLDTPIRRFRKKYDEADFGIGLFNTKSHLLALCVFASGNFMLFPFLFAIKRNYSKGRLDL